MKRCTVFEHSGFFLSLVLVIFVVSGVWCLVFSFSLLGVGWGVSSVDCVCFSILCLMHVADLFTSLLVFVACPLALIWRLTVCVVWGLFFFSYQEFVRTVHHLANGKNLGFVYVIRNT